MLEGSSLGELGHTDGGDAIRLTVPTMGAVDTVDAEEALFGRTVANIQGSSSSPAEFTVSLLYISGFVSRSPRRDSHSSRRSMSSLNPSVWPALLINRCFNNSRATVSLHERSTHNWQV